MMHKRIADTLAGEQQNFLLRLKKRIKVTKVEQIHRMNVRKAPMYQLQDSNVSNDTYSRDAALHLADDEHVYSGDSYSHTESLNVSRYCSVICNTMPVPMHYERTSDLSLCAKPIPTVLNRFSSDFMKRHSHTELLILPFSLLSLSLIVGTYK